MGLCVLWFGLADLHARIHPLLITLQHTGAHPPLTPATSIMQGEVAAAAEALTTHRKQLLHRARQLLQLHRSASPVEEGRVPDSTASLLDTLLADFAQHTLCCGGAGCGGTPSPAR